MSSVPYLVFSQSEGAALPIDRLVAQARAHFDGALVATEAAESMVTRLSYEARGAHGEFDVSTRAASPEDVGAARQAERVAPSGGLADLAARCKKVWVVEPRDQPPEWLVFEFAALLASVALGPIVPPDGMRLLGVRSARERAGDIRGGPRLMR
jgi:hypothetical protein